MFLKTVNMESRRRGYDAESDGNCASLGIGTEKLTSSSSGQPSNDSFPSSTSTWRRCDVGNLGIKTSYRGSAMDVVYEWGLYTMFRKDVKAEELNSVVEILNVCDSVPADFESFEQLYNRFAENREICNEFIPTNKRTGGTGLCLCRFEEFQQRLELILRERMEVNEAAPVSQSNFQTLFEDFLKICGLIPRHQPDIAVNKVKVKGKSVNSEPHMLCYGLEGKVVCVAEVQVKKKIDTADMLETPVREKSRQSAHHPVLSPDCLARHTGELLAYIDCSVTHLEICGKVGRDILGFIVEETFVTITHLQLNDLAWEMIQTSNCEGPVKHEEKPVLYFSRQYNFLNKSDRQELLKAILHVKLMLSVHERLTLERKTKGTTDILSKRRM